MIGWVKAGREAGSTTGSDNYRLDKASHDDLVARLEAALAAMGCAVLVDAVVAECETENCIGYV